MKNSIILIIVLSVYSCQKKDNLGANSIENAQSNVDSAKLNKKKYLQPNDEYRKNVLPYIQIKNNQARLKNLLTKLDSHDISFCEYVRLEYKFDAHVMQQRKINIHRLKCKNLLQTITIAHLIKIIPN